MEERRVKSGNQERIQIPDARSIARYPTLNTFLRPPDASPLHVMPAFRPDRRHVRRPSTPNHGRFVTFFTYVRTLLLSIIFLEILFFVTGTVTLEGGAV